MFGLGTLKSWGLGILGFVVLVLTLGNVNLRRKAAEKEAELSSAEAKSLKKTMEKQQRAQEESDELVKNAERSNPDDRGDIKF